VVDDDNKQMNAKVIMMSQTKLICKGCGSCCLQLKDMIQIYAEDIERWVNQGFWLVLQYCYGWNEHCWDMLFEEKEKLIEHLVESINCEMWFDPETGEQIFLCPFLKKRRGKNKFVCMIHDSKPTMCQDYICDLRDMKGIVKRPFEENLRDYRKRRKQYSSFLKYVYPRERKKK